MKTRQDSFCGPIGRRVGVGVGVPFGRAIPLRESGRCLWVSRPSVSRPAHVARRSARCSCDEVAPDVLTEAAKPRLHVSFRAGTL